MSSGETRVEKERRRLCGEESGGEGQGSVKRRERENAEERLEGEKRGEGIG